ncbi:MAG: hydrogenase maturation protease [Candidatus Thiodiazotropha sp.]
MSNGKDGRILVIGMGNVLMQDEGVGVRAVEELEQRYHIPEGVKLVDGGTTGMELFEPMRGALSNHQLGVSDLLALLALKGETPEQVTIVGMVPHSLENRLGLTPEAEAGLEGMVRMLVDELASLGVQLQPRDRAGNGHWKREAEYELAAGLR